MTQITSWDTKTDRQTDTDSSRQAIFNPQVYSLGVKIYLGGGVRSIRLLGASRCVLRLDLVTPGHARSWFGRKLCSRGRASGRWANIARSVGASLAIGPETWPLWGPKSMRFCGVPSGDASECLGECESADRDRSRLSQAEIGIDQWFPDWSRPAPLGCQGDPPSPNWYTHAKTPFSWVSN